MSTKYIKYLLVLIIGLGFLPQASINAMEQDSSEDSNEDFQYQQLVFKTSEKIPTSRLKGWAEDSSEELFEGQDSIFKTPEKVQTSPFKRKLSGNAIFADDSFHTPEKPLSSNSTSLTPSFGASSLSSPFGLKTPERYIEKTDQDKILTLFVYNFCKFEKKAADNSLFPLIHLFFLLDDNKICSQQHNVSKDCLLDLVSIYDEDYFKRMYQFVNDLINKSNEAKNYEKSEKQKQHSALKKNLVDYGKILKTLPRFLKKNGSLMPENINAIVDYLNINGFDNGSVDVEKLRNEVYVVGTKKDKKGCCVEFIEDKLKELTAEIKSCKATYNIKAEVKNFVITSMNCTLNEVDELFLTQLAGCFEHILIHESYKEHYWKLCPYFMGQFLRLNNALPTRTISKKKLFEESNSQEDIISEEKSNSAESSKRRKFVQQGLYFEYLLDPKAKIKNNTTIIATISNTPLYYLLCFNMKVQEIDDIINNILVERYKNADNAKNYDLLEKLIDGFISIYKSIQDQSTLKKLESTYHQLIKKLSAMAFNKSTFLYSYTFKPLILTALKLDKFLNKNNEILNKAVLINNNHIRCVTFDAGKNKFGGGHLDVSSEIVNEVLPQQFELLKKCELGASKNGIKLVDWLMTKKEEKQCCGNKFSHLFPSCITDLTLHNYCEFIYQESRGKQPKITILEQTNSEKAYNTGIHSMKAVMCEHNHEDGCLQVNCPHSGIMRIMLQLQYELIDKAGEKEKHNTIPVITTLFPAALLYFQRDEAGNVSLNGMLIEKNDQLEDHCKDILCYTRKKGAMIVYDDKTLEPVYQPLALSLDTLKTIASDNDNDMEFYRDGKQKKVVKITDGVYIEIFKN